MKITAKRFDAATVALLTAFAGAATAPGAVSAADPDPYEMISGEVRGVDADNGMITIAHDPIGHLDMPAMTMDFRVPDAAMLDDVSEGTNVEFLAVEMEGELTIRALMTVD